MEDFNLPIPERIALLERLQEAIGNVPPHFWAACQICDLGALERLVNCGREYPGVLRGFTLQTTIMARYWGPTPPAQSQPSTPKTQTPQKPTPSNLGSPPLGSSPSTPPPKRQKTSDSPTVLARSQQVKNLTKQRDNFCCVLTGDRSIEIAHIYPYHSIKYIEEDKVRQRHIFWDHLGCFWPKEKVAAWQAEVFPAGMSGFGVERVYNMITLSRTAHDMWGRGAFALKPISESEDKKTLEVQFFWQEKQTDTQTMSLLTTPLSTKGLCQNVGAFRGAIRLPTNETIPRNLQSGDRFNIQTDDPETKPLPSFKLLELQWFLQRIQGMAGAAEPDWPSYSNSGSDCWDENIPELTLDDEEVRELSLVSAEPLTSPTKPVYNDNLSAHSKHRIEEAEGEEASLVSYSGDRRR